MVQINEDLRLFSSNAVLQLLGLCKPEDEKVCLQWLEFEASQLAPSVALAIAGKSAAHKQSLLSLLKVLEGYATSYTSKVSFKSLKSYFNIF